MKKRDFNKHLKSCVNKKTGLLDIQLIENLPLETKRGMMLFLAKREAPIIRSLIIEDDIPFLFALGYCYERKLGKFDCITKANYYSLIAFYRWMQNPVDTKVKMTYDPETDTHEYSK